MPRRTTPACLAALLLLAGCTADKPAPAPPPPAAAGASAGTSEPKTLESRAVDAGGDRLTMTMTPLIRSGDTVVLTIATRLDRTADDGGIDSAVTRHFSTILATSFDNVRLVDQAGRRVYTVAEQSDGGRCTCTGLQRFKVGETRPLQAAFTGIPAGVGTLSVMLPYAGVFADVPVTAGQVPAPPAGTGINRQDALDLTAPGTSLGADLDAYSERLDVPLRTRRTPKQVDLSLDADVLFRLDSAQLTPAAAKAVAAAIADLRAAGAGPLGVTGHTDNTGTAAHNQGLSEQRARTVATALTNALPDAQWPKTVTGKGDTQPVVPNTTAANRRLNRRVTISYQAKTPATPTPAPSPSAVALPQTKGVRGSAADGVQVVLPLRRGTVRFVSRPAVVRGPFLQVDLVARNAGDIPATVLDYLGQGIFTVRDEFDPYAPFGASGVRVLSGDTASYGLDYVTAKGSHRCLCDRLLNQAIPPGSEQVIALWFPAPPPGTTTITLDVPDKFRIDGVPIS
jgi:outer membrane protein OmpA-like peptidoglycan-associated protein